MPQLFQLFTAPDSALGRLDYQSLTDQTLMEILIDGMQDEGKSKFRDAHGGFKDIGEWEGVQCTDGHVKIIHFGSMKFTNTDFPFSCIPPSVDLFSAMKCAIHGTLDTSALPKNLGFFSVFSNALHGPVDFSSFPRSLGHIHIGSNAFCGSCALRDLPQSLRYFVAYDNQFSGEISLNDLPPELTMLSLYNNNFSGSIRIERLPNSMTRINLSQNEFSGDFVMLAFPRSLISINISGNPLSGTAVLAKATETMRFVIQYKPLRTPEGQGQLRVVGEEGEEHEWHYNVLWHNEVC